VSVIHPTTACEVRVTGDGSVEAFSSTQDIGTGTRTMLAQVVAEEFGLRPEQIGSYIGDTRYPIGPPFGGRRVTGSLTSAAHNVTHCAARDLAAHLAPSLQAQAEDIVFADGGVFVQGNLRPRCLSKMPSGERTSTRSRTAATSATIMTAMPCRPRTSASASTVSAACSLPK
jgi:CO/xanthine dehydrogenase Mo-binding subunit